MSDPLRIFVSHSSDDSALAKAISDRLSQLPGINVLVDMSGLEAGRPWRRQLHEWMARCGAGLVLLTPAVLRRPEWVLKECIILGWRLDLEPRFSLFFALAPGVTREQFDQCGFRLAQLTETQFLPGTLADLGQVEALLEAVRTGLPSTQPATTPYDDLIQELKTLLIMADPQGATYAAIASHLGVAGPVNWGPDQRDKLAEAIAQAIVQGRNQSFAIDELLNRIGAWSAENKNKLVNLLVPYWVEPDTAAELLHRAPPTPPPEQVLPGPGALTIKGAHVPRFTAKMTVRRAYGARLSKFRLAEAVGLGGDLFDDICEELCEHARKRNWVPAALTDKDRVAEELRKSLFPVFVPLAVLPDPETIRLLRAKFPRMLFLAPRPPNRAGPEGDELLPDPPPERESAEYSAWDGAMNAIENG